MDSASTPTHPVVASSSPNAYIFNPNSMKKTTLFARGSPLYTITSDLADTHTYVDDAVTRRRIATITRRDIFPDTITFGDQHHNTGKPISVHKWLRKGKLPDGYPIHSMRTHVGAGEYVWKSDATHRLGLYHVSEVPTQTQCIAYLQLSSQTHRHPCSLFLDPSAEHIRDEIVVAVLILEQRLRITERNINAASGKFELNSTLLGQHLYIN